MTVVSPLFRVAGRFASPGGSKGKLTILTYHRVPAGNDPLFSNDQVDALKFARHMKAISECFNVLPLPQAIEGLAQGTLPARALSITFDDGYLDNYTIALPILQSHGLKATFFVCSGYLNDGLMFNDVIAEALRACHADQLDLSWLGLGLLTVGDIRAKRQASELILNAVKYLPFAEREAACDRFWQAAAPGKVRPRLMMNDEQIRKLVSQGMTIGGHTHTHPILNRLDLDSARKDIALNRQILTKLIGHEPVVFAYPNGRPVRDYGHEHVKLLQEAGYKSAVSTAWGVATKACDQFQLPRFSPWDDDPRRLVLRLLKNAVTGQQPLTAKATS